MINRKRKFLRNHSNKTTTQTLSIHYAIIVVGVYAGFNCSIYCLHQTLKYTREPYKGSKDRFAKPTKAKCTWYITIITIHQVA